MKERLMVHGKKHWIADKDCKILVSYHDSPKEAKAALRALKIHEKKEGYYVAGFYEIVEGVLGALRLRGYTALEDIAVMSDVISAR